MLKDLKISLYDLFGFLLPGIVLLFAITMIFLTVSHPHKPIGFPIFSVSGWIAILLGSYLLGHFVQAVGNLLADYLPSSEELVIEGKSDIGLSEELILSAKEKIATLFQIKCDGLDSKTIYAICDETVLQLGNIRDREMFVYREGFYRGLAISSVILLLAEFWRTITPEFSLSISGCVYPVNWFISVLIILITSTSVWFFWRRHRRFASYRVRNSIIGFLVVMSKKNGETKKSEN